MNNSPIHDNLSTISVATLRIGNSALTEQNIKDLDEMLEFFKVFIEQNPQAKEILIAVRAKQRIAG